MSDHENDDWYLNEYRRTKKPITHMTLDELLDSPLRCFTDLVQTREDAPEQDGINPVDNDTTRALLNILERMETTLNNIDKSLAALLENDDERSESSPVDGGVPKGVWRHKNDMTGCYNWPDSIDWTYNPNGTFICRPHDEEMVCVPRR